MEFSTVTVRGNIDEFEVVKGGQRVASKKAIRIVWDAWAGGNKIGNLSGSATNEIKATNHRNGDLSLKAPDYVWAAAERVAYVTGQ